MANSTHPPVSQSNIDASDARYTEVGHARFAAHDEYLRTGELAALDAWYALEKEYSRILEARQRAGQARRDGAK